MRCYQGFLVLTALLLMLPWTAHSADTTAPAAAPTTTAPAAAPTDDTTAPTVTIESPSKIETPTATTVNDPKKLALFLDNLLKISSVQEYNLEQLHIQINQLLKAINKKTDLNYKTFTEQAAVTELKIQALLNQLNFASNKSQADLDALNAKGKEFETNIVKFENMLEELRNRPIVPPGLLEKIDDLQDQINLLRRKPGEDYVLNPSLVNRTEIYSLRIVNAAKGEIGVSQDGGKTWKTIGHVLAPAVANDYQTNLTHIWSLTGVVSATSYDGITIRSGYNESAQRGQLFSILPKSAGARGGMRLSTQARHATIITDLAAGEGIFGDNFGPITGDPILLDTPNGLRYMPVDYTPATGDTYVISVLQPIASQASYEIENCAGGNITEYAADGSHHIVGKVVRPLRGIGRSDKSSFAAAGRITGDINGKVDISVAPPGIVVPLGESADYKAGGFSIELCERGMDAQTMHVMNKPQVMLVQELKAHDPTWSGMAPLFMGYLHPRWSHKDIGEADWEHRLMSRARVEVQNDNDGKWVAMPGFPLSGDTKSALPKWTQTALSHVTKLKISLPAPPDPADYHPATIDTSPEDSSEATPPVGTPVNNPAVPAPVTTPPAGTQPATTVPAAK